MALSCAMNKDTMFLAVIIYYYGLIRYLFVTREET